MKQDLSPFENQIQTVSSFEALVSTPFLGEMNAICWNRTLEGDFAEIVDKFEITENLEEIELDELRDLKLSTQGNLAREILFKDYELLKDYGASPSLNIIEFYERDDSFPFFPTDVYSYHVDRSPIPTATFLCTYFGAASELISNTEAEKKVLVPEIRAELRKLFHGKEEDFDAFLTENFFDLHYQANPTAIPINLGIGNLWRLAVDHPESDYLPCVHRAPKEKIGEKRLLLIC
jgi:hypothetical protein